VRDSLHCFRSNLAPITHAHLAIMRIFSPAFLARTVLTTTQVSAHAVVREHVGECCFPANGLVHSLVLCIDLHVLCGSPEARTASGLSPVTLENSCRGF
jgi:hypothetical protein